MISTPDLNAVFGFSVVVACAGFAAGFVGGLFGGGGGMIVIPTLYQAFERLGVPADVRLHLVVGTSLAAVVPLSVLGARSHWRQGNVDIAMLKPLLPAALLGSIAAGVVGRRLDAHALAWLFVAVAALTSWRMVGQSKPQAIASEQTRPQRLGKPAMGVLGLAIGCVSTLVGIGGATLTVPVLHLSGAKMRHAIGTSATLGMAIALPGAASLALAGSTAENLPIGSFGYVNLVAAAILFAVGAVGVSAGSRLTKRLDEKLLRRLFAVLLMASAVRLAVSTA
ncbi:sulfite exporter TauE/SafE family protein [Variovorax paradoxus]|uniref:sulfite exporter TauE/SafE family protein n=1 Tax=Variovorax paradoxus TaxID=34073 RepID=UPI0021ACB392|nr:sulfite exporter TauE/SafE family protein [Variovorax paradoxus]UVH55134.1 sulfite exporter TauE/SafE family protein [Variovorax paradoxus]